MGEQEEERRNNFVHPEKSFLQIIFDEVRERTWFGSTPCVACGRSSTGLNTWESRALPYI